MTRVLQIAFTLASEVHCAGAIVSHHRASDWRASTFAGRPACGENEGSRLQRVETCFRCRRGITSVVPSLLVSGWGSAQRSFWHACDGRIARRGATALPPASRSEWGRRLEVT
jgi:hypothetical protein